MYGILKTNHLNTSSSFEILQKLLGGLKIQGELIFYESPDTGAPLAFLVNETLSFHNKCQNHSCKWNLGN